MRPFLSTTMPPWVGPIFSLSGTFPHWGTVLKVFAPLPVTTAMESFASSRGAGCPPGTSSAWAKRAAASRSGIGRREKRMAGRMEIRGSGSSAVWQAKGARADGAEADDDLALVAAEVDDLKHLQRE